MATQTGECSIDTIDGAVVRGTFTSVYDCNVYAADAVLAARVLKDAFLQLAGQDRDGAELERSVRRVEFATPNTPSTRFVIEMHDARALAGLKPGSWSSYYVG